MFFQCRDQGFSKGVPSACFLETSFLAEIPGVVGFDDDGGDAWLAQKEDSLAGWVSVDKNARAEGIQIVEVFVVLAAVREKTGLGQTFGHGPGQAVARLCQFERAFVRPQDGKSGGVEVVHATLAGRRRPFAPFAAHVRVDADDDLGPEGFRCRKAWSVLGAGGGASAQADLEVIRAGEEGREVLGHGQVEVLLFDAQTGRVAGVARVAVAGVQEDFVLAEVVGKDRRRGAEREPGRGPG